MPEWFDSPNEMLVVVGLCSAVFGGLFWVIDARISKVIHAVTPNSGMSMRDAVDRIETKLDTHIQWHLEKTNE
tara:strand:+ start:779 stop:997 length:219 start_codon:yes stop_codon:yes gene_type:complete